MRTTGNPPDSYPGRNGVEGDLFRKVFGWSIVLMLLMCAIVYLQSTAVLDWMVVK
jgi:lactate permease